MPQQSVTNAGLPRALEVVKKMQVDGMDWGGDTTRLAAWRWLRSSMAEAVDRWLDSLDGSALRDRCNRRNSRHLLSELGDIELSVLHTRPLPNRYPAQLCTARAGDRPRDSGRLRARAVNPQGR